MLIILCLLQILICWFLPLKLSEYLTTRGIHGAVLFIVAFIACAFAILLWIVGTALVIQQGGSPGTLTAAGFVGVVSAIWATVRGRKKAFTASP